MEGKEPARRLNRAEAPASGSGREPDPEFLEACRKGDPEALGSLFDRYKDHVYSLAVHLTRDPSLAADVTQEVFLKLLTRITQFRGEARFRTWLARIVVNAAWDQKRASRGTRALEEESEVHAPLAAASPEDNAARDEAARAVRKAVARLNARLRAPLVLRYIGGLSYEEIGEALGISPGTVASRLFRALRTLARTEPSLRGHRE